jgi:hypothetical protein
MAGKTKRKKNNKKNTTGVNALKTAAAARNNSMMMVPVAYASSTSVPKLMTRSIVGGINVRHREYFHDLLGPANGNLYIFGFNINPGVCITFPWLCSIARNFETYRFNSLKFVFHTRTNTSMNGSVSLVFDFDAADPAPFDTISALTTQDHVLGPTYADMTLDIDMSGDRQKYRYTRAGEIAGTDIKTYDFGKLWVMIEGMLSSHSGRSTGLLEAIYDIDLYTPQCSEPVAGALEGNHPLGVAPGGELLEGATPLSPKARLPGNVVYDAATSSWNFIFSQYWSGILASTLTGTTLASLAWSIVDNPLQTAAIETIAPTIVSSAGTTARLIEQLYATPGTVIHPAWGGVAANILTTDFAECSWDQCYI